MYQVETSVTLNCGHCGCSHNGTCQRIKAMEYYPDGTVKRVEYHDQTPVVFPPLLPIPVSDWIPPGTIYSEGVTIDTNRFGGVDSDTRRVTAAELSVSGSPRLNAVQ